VKQLPCNSPRRTSSGPKKFVVRACSGGQSKTIRFGDRNMKIRKSNPGRRRNFRARHRCDSAPPGKLTARYWSCRKW
jgi:hypothetical protein